MDNRSVKTVVFDTADNFVSEKLEPLSTGAVLDDAERT